MRRHTERVAAAVEVGDLVADDPEALAYHLWACEHGYAMLHLFLMREGADGLDYDAAYRRILDGVAPRTRRRSSP